MIFWNMYVTGRTNIWKSCWCTLGHKGGLWRLKLWVQRVTNSGNHEHRSCATSAKSKMIDEKTFDNKNICTNHLALPFLKYRWRWTHRPPQTLNTISPCKGHDGCSQGLQVPPPMDGSDGLRDVWRWFAVLEPHWSPVGDTAPIGLQRALNRTNPLWALFIAPGKYKRHISNDLLRFEFAFINKKLVKLGQDFSKNNSGLLLS